MAAEKVRTSDKKIQEHHIGILQMVEAFLSEYLVTEDSPTNRGSGRKPLRSDIRAVILSGDASARGFGHLKAVLQHLFHGLQPSWLKDSIEPAAVAAVGAAKLANQLSLNAPKGQSSPGTLSDNHDEL